VRIHEAAAIYGTTRSLALADELPLDEPATVASAGTAIPTYRYVTRTPGICSGRPILRGTRVTVRTIVGYHKLGLSVDEILASLPHLTPAQVYEALAGAAVERVIAAPAQFDNGQPFAPQVQALLAQVPLTADAIEMLV
jgi:uncharacterized protein (DUF433 family)